MVLITHIKIIFSAGLCLIVSSCKVNIDNHEDYSSSSRDTIHAPEVVFDVSMRMALGKEIKNFRKEIGQKPNVVRVEILNPVSEPSKFRIVCLLNMYFSKDERIFLKEQIRGATTISGIPVIVIGGNSLYGFETHLNFGDAKYISYLLGGNLTSCETVYLKDRGKFVVIERECPSAVFTD